MNLTYTLALEDYKAALRLHRRHCLSSRLVSLILPTLIVLGAALSLIGSVTKVEALLRVGLPLLGGGLAGGLASIITRRYNVRRCFNQLFPPGRTDRTSALDIDDERIISSIPGVSEGKFFWNGIVQFAQDDRITLIYVAKYRFLFIPTSFMNEVQRAELSALIQRKNIKSLTC
jgi:hypothetical protein